MDPAKEDIEINLRLISNIIVMGFDIEKDNLTLENIMKNELHARFLDCYPEVNMEKLPSYLEHFNLWCFPEGIRIYGENLNQLNGNSEYTSLTKQPEKEQIPQPQNPSIAQKDELVHFVMTDQDNVKRYCTSLLFHENRYIRSDSDYKSKRERISSFIPKVSLTNLMKNPLTIDENYALVYVPKSISLISYIPIFDTQKQILRYFYHDLISYKRNQNIDRVISIPGAYFLKFSETLNLEGEERVDHKWEKNFDSLKADIAAKKQADSESLKSKGRSASDNVNTEDFCIKETHIVEFYMSAIFSLIEVKSEATEVSILKLYPEKVPQNTKKQSVKNEPQKYAEFLRYRINDSMGINLPTFSFKALFKKLSLINIVRIIKHMLIERQIIIFSSQPGDIASLTEALFLLISPLSWCCIYVPYMPAIMWETLHAMMPYVIGMHRKYKEFIEENLDTSDKIIVDLDDDTVKGEEVCKLPKKPKEFLFTRMAALLKPIENITSNSEINWGELCLKTIQNFNIFLLMIVNKFTQFFKEEYHPTEPDQLPTATDVFDHKEYIESFPDDDQVYMEMLSKGTMMFNKFVEDSYVIMQNSEIMNNLDKQKDEISLFLRNLKLVERFNNQFRFGAVRPVLDVTTGKVLDLLEAEQKQHINNALFRSKMPSQIDMHLYLVKYLKFFNFISENSLLREPRTRAAADKSSFEMLKSLDIRKLNKENILFSKLRKERIINVKEPFKKRAEKKALEAKRAREKSKIFSKPKELAAEKSQNLGFEDNTELVGFPADTLRKTNGFIYHQAVARNQPRYSTRIEGSVRRGSVFGYPNIGSPGVLEETKSDPPRLGNIQSISIQGRRDSKASLERKDPLAEQDLHRVMGLPDLPTIKTNEATQQELQEEFNMYGRLTNRNMFHRKSDSKIFVNRRKLIFEDLEGACLNGSSSDENENKNDDGGLQTPPRQFPKKEEKKRVLGPVTMSMPEHSFKSFRGSRGLNYGELRSQEFKGDIDQSPYTSPARSKKKIFSDDMQTSKFLSDKKKLYEQGNFIAGSSPTDWRVNLPQELGQKVRVFHSLNVNRNIKRYESHSDEPSPQKIRPNNKQDMMIKDIETGKLVPWQELDNELEHFKSKTHKQE